MSRVRMSLRSRRMVRRNREWFALMDETGLTSDQLRTFMALRDAISEIIGPVSEAFASVCRAASAAMGAVSDGLHPALEAMRDAGLPSGEDEGGDAR